MTSTLLQHIATTHHEGDFTIATRPVRHKSNTKQGKSFVDLFFLQPCMEHTSMENQMISFAVNKEDQFPAHALWDIEEDCSMPPATNVRVIWTAACFLRNQCPIEQNI